MTAVTAETAMTAIPSPSPSEVVVWVHGDCLSPAHAGLQAYPHAPAIFVFDDELLARTRISFKRLTFLYECLLELPVVIRRGDVAREVAQFAREHSAGRVVTTLSVSPRFRQIAAALEQQCALDILPIEPFIDYTGRLDLKRFSRYWQIAERYAFGQARLFD